MTELMFFLRNKKTLRLVIYAFVFVMHVVVIYFLFLISMCVLLVVITCAVNRLHIYGERKFAVPMPTYVSKYNLEQLRSKCISAV